jgi:dTDP-glucose pyrophosphorylase
MFYRGRSIKPQKNLLEAMKQMDALGKKLLIVIDKDKFVGLLSVGDIQRAIIQNKPLETKIGNILRNNVKVLRAGDSMDIVKQMMLEYRMELCPLVNENNVIEKVYYWEDLFLEKKPKPAEQFNLPVVIMAGGIGSRLKPLTNVLPKPLIPIGEKPIIEEIFERFGNHGCNEFFVSVNYKSELIEFYLRNRQLPYQLSFFKEEKPMGTAGSLSLLKDKINQTFFVNNCDILIEQDYSEILDFHRQSKNEITIVAALKNYSIPYGVIETGNNGALLDILEKPEFTFKINSGMYIIEPHLLTEIPVNEFYYITQLINKVKSRKGHIGVFPVSEGSWKDIGSWEEYKKYI